MADPIAGPSFPFRIDPTTGGVAWAFGTDKLRQNIRLIIGTRYGERPMLRDFGTRVHQLVHDPNDAVLADLLKQQVHQSLLQFEPRILLTQTSVQQSEGELHMVLNYMQTTAPIADQLVLPLL
jgi:phage baseplate assembly protein W